MIKKRMNEPADKNCPFHLLAWQLAANVKRERSEADLQRSIWPRSSWEQDSINGRAWGTRRRKSEQNKQTNMNPLLSIMTGAQAPDKALKVPKRLCVTWILPDYLFLWGLARFHVFDDCRSHSLTQRNAKLEEHQQDKFVGSLCLVGISEVCRLQHAGPDALIINPVRHCSYHIRQQCGCAVNEFAELVHLQVKGVTVCLLCCGIKEQATRCQKMDVQCDNAATTISSNAAV